MMNYLQIVVIFLLVLFIYIHIQFQITSADERQIYVIDKPVNAPIEDVFELKQPIVFRMLSIINITLENLLSHHHNIDISVYDNTRKNTHSNILSSISATHALVKGDAHAKYYSEKNTDIFSRIPTTSPLHEITKKHAIFTPPLCSRTYNDVLFGSVGSTTIPQYSVMFRNIFSVTSGTLHIRLIHPDDFANRGEQIKPDYTNMSFFASSDTDLWNDNDNNIIKATIHMGESFSIPPYWVYSFQYEEDTFVSSTSFNSYMTEIATAQHTLLYWVTKFTRPRNISTHTHATPYTDKNIISKQTTDSTVTNNDINNTNTETTDTEQHSKIDTDTIPDTNLQTDNDSGTSASNDTTSILDVMVPSTS